MTAIITDQLKRQMVGDIFADLTDSADARYYIGIGRSEGWDDSSDTPTVPQNTEREGRKFRSSLQSLKRVESYSFVVPRYNWSSGTVYSGYNDNVTGHPTTPYYVITDDNAVYICIERGTNTAGLPVPSTVKPTGAATTAFRTADGYAWKFLYSIGTLDASKFLSANYMPVRLQGATTGESLATEIEQETIQNAAIAGQIANVSVTNGGSGYTSSPTAILYGNGGTLTLDADAVSGTVTRIRLSDDGSGGVLQGSDFDYGTVVITGGGGTGATARVSLGPKDGFGADPRVDLRASAIMFNIKPSGDEDGEFLDEASFRQIGIMRNPYEPDSAGDGALFTGAAGLTLKSMAMSGKSGAFTVGEQVTSTGGKAAIIDKDSGDYIWYHHSEETGYIAFEDGDAVTDGIETATADSAAISPTVNPFTGELLYIESRSKIQREASPPSTEDIKVIIEI
jgi:hypothetical protein